VQKGQIYRINKRVVANAVIIGYVTYLLSDISVTSPIKGENIIFEIINKY